MKRTMTTQTAKRFSNMSDTTVTSRCPIVCEILDGRTQATILGNPSLWGAADWMQTNFMVSQILSMVAENRNVKCILDELLGAEGVSLNLVPSAAYVRKGDALSFAMLARRVLTKNCVLCGYQRANKTVINPREKSAPQTWEDCMMVVLKGDSGQKKTATGLKDGRGTTMQTSPVEPLDKPWAEERFLALEQQIADLKGLLGAGAGTEALAANVRESSAVCAGADPCPKCDIVAGTPSSNLPPYRGHGRIQGKQLPVLPPVAREVRPAIPIYTGVVTHEI